MRKVFIAAFVIMLTGLWAQYSGVYEIYSADQKIGECRFEMKKHPMGFVLSATTTMTIAGTQTIYTSETYLDAGYHPSSYNVKVSMPSGNQEISAIFEHGMVNITGNAGIKQTEQKIPFARNGYILDQNLFAHFWILNNVINPRLGNIDLNIVIPQLMTSVKLDVVNEEQKKYNGKDASHFIGKLGDTDIELWISLDGKIISVIYPTQKIEVKLGEIKSLAEESAKLPEGYNPISDNEISDKDYMKPIFKCKKFKVHISFDPQGRLDKIYLNRRQQTYLGSIDQHSVDGELDIQKLSHRVTLSGEWPLLEPLVSDPEFSAPAPGIDSDDDEIINRANAIVESAKTIWDAARGINLWVNRNITLKPVRYTAKDAIIKGKGDPLTKALVCTAMLRSIGIPARVVQGILFADVQLDHSWVEVFLGQELGWAPMDPTTNEVDDLSARHISLWVGEEKPPVYAKDITIDKIK
ncbi:transglutaminase domain-containing protein [bacterium]|nr:transglutaminase domain-containing protein [bacterium]